MNFKSNILVFLLLFTCLGVAFSNNTEVTGEPSDIENVVEEAADTVSVDVTLTSVNGLLLINAEVSQPTTVSIYTSDDHFLKDVTLQELPAAIPLTRGEYKVEIWKKKYDVVIK